MMFFVESPEGVNRKGISEPLLFDYAIPLNHTRTRCLSGRRGRRNVEKDIYYVRAGAGLPLEVG